MKVYYPDMFGSLREFFKVFENERPDYVDDQDIYFGFIENVETFHYHENTLVYVYTSAGVITFWYSTNRSVVLFEPEDGEAFAIVTRKYVPSVFSIKYVHVTLSPLSKERDEVNEVVKEVRDKIGESSG